MDRRLIEAANEGDVEKLRNLTKDYPLLLKAAALSSGETPLHIACLGGHVDFVREVLNLTPEFTKELNQDGLSPLHIASANGNRDIVKELLIKAGSHIWLVKGKENRIPFHYAVVKGRVEVIEELLSVCPDSVREVTARGETCFHLAVKNNQFEVFKALCEHVVSSGKEDILNIKDEQGNTCLHLAASRKQYQVADFLLDENFYNKVKLEVNLLNKKGLTPLDVLISEGGDCEIEEMLTLSGATRGAASPTDVVISTQDPATQEQRRDQPKSAYKKLQDYFKYDKNKESPSKARNTLLVISILIVTGTYQAVLSPPGGVWQEDYLPDSAKNNTMNGKEQAHHNAGQSVMATNDMVSYGLFLFFNSIGFYMSLHMMNFLTHGLPLQFELRVALAALIATYNTCMLAITPLGKIFVSFIVFIILTPFLLIALTKEVRDFNKRKWCPTING